jgi:hypothetical protein
MAVLNDVLSPVWKWCDYLVLVHCCDKSVIIKLVKFVRSIETNVFDLAVLCVQCNCTTLILVTDTSLTK